MVYFIVLLRFSTKYCYLILIFLFFFKTILAIDVFRAASKFNKRIFIPEHRIEAERANEYPWIA